MTENERNLIGENAEEEVTAAAGQGADTAPEEQPCGQSQDGTPGAQPDGEAVPPEDAAAEPVCDAEPADDPASAEEGAAEDGAAPEEEGAEADGAADAQPQTVRRLNVKKLVITIVAVVVAAALIGVGAFYGVRYWNEQRLERNGFGSTALTDYASYTYENQADAEKNNSLTVARMDGQELTGGPLQIYYWSQYYSFLSTYGDYAYYFGLDTSLPLDEQTISGDATGEEDQEMTWEQSFLQQALEMYRQYAALAQEAEAAGFAIGADQQANIEGIPDSMGEYAVASGYADANDYLAQSFGPGVTVEDYMEFARLYAIAAGYASELQAGIACTDEEIEAYYDANTENYTANGVEKVDKPVVNVRHILIQPEYDEDTDDDGTMDTASEEAWKAAEEKAQALYEQWQEEPTEDNFSAMADENSTDSGSNTNGGLYEGVYPGQMVTEFDSWCFDDARAVGDTGIVKTDYGYHIMYYAGAGDTIYWFETAKTDCASEKFNTMLEEIFDRHTLEVNYHNIHIFDLMGTMAAAEEVPADEAAAE